MSAPTNLRERDACLTFSGTGWTPEQNSPSPRNTSSCIPVLVVQEFPKVVKHQVGHTAGEDDGVHRANLLENGTRPVTIRLAEMDGDTTAGVLPVTSGGGSNQFIQTLLPACEESELVVSVRGIYASEINLTSM